MARVLFCLAVLLFCGPVWSADTRVFTEARIKPTAEGLGADYRLSRPVTRYTFERAVTDIRTEGWILPDGFRWEGEAVVRADGQAFRRFTVLVRPDTKQRDRIYPALTRVGPKGWQYYAPYFKGEQDNGATLMKVRTPMGWMRLPVGGSRGEGFAYLGPRAYVTTGRTTVVAGPEVPRWLLATLSAKAEAMDAYYTRRLGVALPMRPVMIVTWTPGSGGEFRGDVTPGGMVSLRFQGDPWAVDDSTAAKGVSAFVGHEYFHFWNGWLFKPREFDRESWLHEGAAEYASLLAALELDDLDDAGMRAALGRRLAGCADMLGSRSLSADPPRGGNAVYDCGVVAAWAADLQVRSDSGGRRDVVDLWRDTFRATGPDRVYDVASFMSQLRAPAGSPWRRLLVDDGGPTRWRDIATSMEALGAKLEAGRAPDKERATLIFHLMALSCGDGAVGFYGEADHLKLDGPATCGPLKSGQLVDAFEGHSLMTAQSAAFDAGKAACAAGRRVTFTYKGQPAGSIVCDKPLGPAPIAFTVLKWR